MPRSEKLTEFTAQELSLDEFESKYRAQKKPVVVRGLANHWPLVAKAKIDATEAANYLIENDSHIPSYTIVGSPEIEGRFFYAQDLSGTNFKSFDLAATAVLEQLIKFAKISPEQVHAMSFQAANVSTCFPKLVNELGLELLDRSVTPTIWINNQSRVAAHFDLNDNIACVASGSRTFTLFPPAQTKNLYLGPMLRSPGGVPTSLVDVKHPDYDAYPKFAIAMDNSLTATLDPGDAIFIPSPWWHAVESHKPINILVNYWWNKHLDNSLPNANNALMMAMLALAEMDSPQKQSWQHLFNYFVFNDGAAPADHLPSEVDDLSNHPSDTTKSQCVDFLFEQLRAQKT